MDRSHLHCSLLAILLALAPALAPAAPDHLTPRQGPHADRRGARRQRRRHDSRLGRRADEAAPRLDARSRATSIRSRTTSRCSRSPARTSTQYKSKLTTGEIALLKKYPEFKMNVYPTRRTAALPKDVTDRVAAQAGKVTLQGFGLQDLGGSTTPFPIPQNGLEAIWNHLVRYLGGGAIALGPLVPGARQRRLLQDRLPLEAHLRARTSRTRSRTASSTRSAISPSRRRCAARSSWCTNRWTRWRSSARPGSTTPARDACGVPRT